MHFFRLAQLFSRKSSRRRPAVLLVCPQRISNGFIPRTHGILLYFFSKIGQITKMNLKQYNFKLHLFPQLINFLLYLHISLPKFVYFISNMIFLQQKVCLEITYADIDVIKASLALLSELFFHDGKVIDEFLFLHVHFDLVVSFVIFECSEYVGDLFVERTGQVGMSILTWITIYKPWRSMSIKGLFLAIQLLGIAFLFAITYCNCNLAECLMCLFIDY